MSFNANRYDKLYKDRSKEIEFLVKYLRGDSVLDLGGGTGIISQELNRRSFKCTNWEPQREMAAISHKRGVCTHFEPLLDPIDSIYGKTIYDNVIMVFDVFNFLKNPQQTLGNIKEQLKGRLIFSYWNSNIKKSGWEFNWKLMRLSHKRWTGDKVQIDFWFPFFHERHNLTVYSHKYIEGLLKDFGFKIIKKFREKYTTTIVAKI